MDCEGNRNAPGREFEVFLSFCGDDTRKGFADMLYHDLESAEIRTFRDSENLHVGKAIGSDLLKAIRESKISIPIFSKNYASRQWCLRELVQMVECQKEPLEQKIFPIFYDVKPDDVKHQTGSYEAAFRGHTPVFDENTINGWKRALREVGDLKGWELDKETKGHEGELIKKIVSKVLLELKKNHMFVTSNLVGINHHIEKMMRLLNVKSTNVVGIHGMGGIGKTTIAKVIYNQLSVNFEYCCFLKNVQKRLQRDGLVTLQEELIKKILKRKNVDIFGVEDGCNMIRDMVCTKKVLIVLDNVDKKSQFDKLAGKRKWFDVEGSIIIVTTRNKEVLDEVDEIYEPSCMNFDHSLQLFSKLAFGEESPPEDFNFLSEEIVSTTEGLPLALTKIGMFLDKKGREIWGETLIERKERPHEKVHKKLATSFRALNYEQRAIFLDIACLFNEEDTLRPIYMWKDCGYYPKSMLTILQDRSLIKIGADNVLRMHGQLRDLGREIVRMEDKKNPGARSRLWVYEEALKIFKKQMGTNTIEALCLGPLGLKEDLEQGCHGRYFTNEQFSQLQSLRFLRVGYRDLAGDFHLLLPDLRWLHWCRRSANFILKNFHLENLVILDLSYSDITHDWEAWSQIKVS
ncbi:hypothetical protein L1049_021134 [Liquidambar formosana]|uniref:TIR domain-containing protein n=1 Tax=Liquidambar formosana TaxID=63359 RepID=A0AAP0S8U7_LIQFO